MLESNPLSPPKGFPALRRGLNAPPAPRGVGMVPSSTSNLGDEGLPRWSQRPGPEKPRPLLRVRDHDGDLWERRAVAFAVPQARSRVQTESYSMTEPA